jgi:Ca-activated chloride channel family protein
VVVALDVSKSMLAKDVSPSRAGNRLSRAKMEVSGLIDRLQGDRIGLVAFSGAAFVQCPLTSDYAAAKLFLRAMKAGSIPVGGTNLSEALRAARLMFEGSRGGSRSKVVVIISDGEDHEGGYEEEVEKMRSLGVRISAVGIGTQIGELIPDDQGRYMRSQGKTIMTRLQESTLRAVAEATGGMYIHSAAGDLGFEAIYDMLSRMHKSEYESRVESVYEEKYQLFAFVGLLLLLAATVVPARGQPHRLRAGRKP